MVSEKRNSPLIAVTMGDPAGVGPEICLRILREPLVLRQCVPLVFGDAKVLSLVSEKCRLPEAPRILNKSEWEKNAEAISAPAVVDFAAINGATVKPGKVQAGCGKAAYAYIEGAIGAAMQGRVAAIATAPLNKEALRLAGIRHPGHTEILTSLTGAKRSCLMLASDDLTLTFVTLHIGYLEVPNLLKPDRILDVIELTAQVLARIGRTPARIAVCGLNPHAGENGLFGQREEERLIQPALDAAQRKGIDVEGPFPPDTVFVPERRLRFGAIICMYHDQGHIPFKMLNFDKGVNITLGLPIVRTSVDHGTAFDIAWTGRASATSLVEAILWAVRLAD